MFETFLLHFYQGSEAIRSMVIRLSEIKELQLSPQAFAKMSKLKYLDIYTNGSPNEGSLSLPRGLEYLPNELRYLRWEYYPLESLPSMFSAENLVTLSFPYSRLKKLWHRVKVSNVYILIDFDSPKYYHILIFIIPKNVSTLVCS